MSRNLIHSFIAVSVLAIVGIATAQVLTPEAEYRFEDDFTDSSGHGKDASQGASPSNVTFTDDNCNGTRSGLWPNEITQLDYIICPSTLGYSYFAGDDNDYLNIAFLVKTEDFTLEIETFLS